MVRPRRHGRGARRTARASDPPRVEDAVAAGSGLLEERLDQLQEELAAVVGDTSLCAISRSAGSVPAAKHLEGRAAALMALRRALRRGEQLPGPLTTLLHEWRRALDDVTARDAGADWRAYRAGGLDELKELADRLADAAR